MAAQRPQRPPRPVHHQYGVLLVLILASLAFQLAAGDSDWARLLAVVLQAGTLIAAVITSRAAGWVIRLTIGACAVLVAGSVTAILGTEALEGDSARLVTLLLVALAPPVIVGGMIEQFRSERLISIQMMFGVLCIYLLIGLFYGSAFGVIETLSGEPFFAHGVGNTSNFLYFSYATITTTGYGDLVAGTNLGRSLAITEALIGQIYMVSVVALIVANIGTSPKRRPQA
ncbi:MAG TPA: potassium channel family protein [Solirubrobacterales bacterium]|nr:potassium channel family protein [Solirubrobacterales bacterium]